MTGIPGLGGADVAGVVVKSDPLRQCGKQPLQALAMGRRRVDVRGRTVGVPADRTMGFDRHRQAERLQSAVAGDKGLDQLLPERLRHFGVGGEAREKPHLPGTAGGGRLRLRQRLRDGGGMRGGIGKREIVLDAAAGSGDAARLGEPPEGGAVGRRRLLGQPPHLTAADPELQLFKSKLRRDLEMFAHRQVAKAPLAAAHPQRAARGGRACGLIGGGCGSVAGDRCGCDRRHAMTPVIG